MRLAPNKTRMSTRTAGKSFGKGNAIAPESVIMLEARGTILKVMGAPVRLRMFGAHLRTRLRLTGPGPMIDFLFKLTYDPPPCVWALGATRLERGSARKTEVNVVTRDISVRRIRNVTLRFKHPRPFLVFGDGILHDLRMILVSFPGSPPEQTLEF